MTPVVVHRVMHCAMHRVMHRAMHRVMHRAMHRAMHLSAMPSQVTPYVVTKKTVFKWQEGYTQCIA